MTSGRTEADLAARDLTMTPLTEADAADIPTPCPTCAGTGKVELIYATYIDMATGKAVSAAPMVGVPRTIFPNATDPPMSATCPRCNGTGEKPTTCVAEEEVSEYYKSRPYEAMRPGEE